MIQFTKIYSNYYPMMYRVALKMTIPHQAAEDIIHDTFIYLFEKINKGLLVTHYSSWLYRATFNKCIDYLKNESKFNKLELVKNFQTAEPYFTNQDTEQLLKNALNTLSENERFTAILYSEGLSYKEISETTGIKLTSVGKMLSRTLKKLEKELKKEYHELF